MKSRLLLQVHTIALVAGISALHGSLVAGQALRSEVRARNGVVAAGRTFSAEAGAQLLAAGGNAIDVV